MSWGGAGAQRESRRLFRRRTSLRPVHGFVMEQHFGHRTFARNLRAVIEELPEFRAAWLGLAPGPSGGIVSRLIDNWTLTSGVRARRAVNAERDRMRSLFFFTQIPATINRDLVRRIPTVLGLDGTPVNIDQVADAYGHRHHAAPVETAKRAVVGSTLRAAAALTPFSEWAARSLRDDYSVAAERITVLPPGVDLDDWRVEDRGEAAGPLRVLFVGSDFERKGGPIVLDALADLPGATLDVVTGSEVASRADVHVQGALEPNSPALRARFAEADLLVLPSRGECFPFVLQEAAAAGLPAVAADVGAVSEIVIPGRSGLLVPPTDAGALREAIAQLADDPARRRALGAGARALAEERFDSRRNGRRLATLLESVAT